MTEIIARVLTLVLVGGAVIYLAALATIVSGLLRLRRVPLVGPDRHPFVSVVIPARNEVRSIAACVESVMRSSYPRERFEVLIVDDGSSDGTGPVARETARAINANLLDETAVTVISTATGRRGRSAALDAGISSAKGDWILTVDGDCVVEETWIAAMVRALNDAVVFVAGPVAFSSAKSAFLGVLELEFTGLVGVGAGSIGVGAPTICNGANMLFLKSEYMAFVKDFADRSGTLALDEQLMHFCHRRQRGGVAFCSSRGATVTTAPPRSVGEFVEQRARWASLIPRLPRWVVVACLPIYLFLLAIVLSTLLLPLAPQIAPVLVASFVVKCVADWAVLSSTARMIGTKRILRYLPVAELIHAPYITYSAARGILTPGIWKGRHLVAPVRAGVTQ